VNGLVDRQSSRASLRRHLLTEPPRPAAIRASPRAHWYVVGTVCVGAFMGQLDASIVTLALPRLGRDLHTSVGAVEWVALTYLLVLVATVASVGRLADAVGRKLLYVYGFGVFTVGSVLCGLAPTLVVLLAARVLQAVGAAMLQANSVALIAEAMPPQLLGRGIGMQGTAQALGLALGPAAGGALLALGGWRLIFLVNLPAGAVGLVLGWFLLPRSRSRRAVGRGDRLGAGLLALAASGPLLYLSLAGHAGYANPAILAALVTGAAATIAFVRRERRVPDPLIDLSLLRRRALSTGLSSGLASYLVLFGTLFAVPYSLSSTGTSPPLIGLELSVLPVAIGIAAPVAGRLLDRVGGRPLTAGGLLLTATGLLEVALWHSTTGLLAGLALAGLGLGAFTPANNATIMSASPKGYAGVVSGMLNMARGVGTALGVALASAVYLAASGASAQRGSLSSAGSGLTAALAALGSIALGVGVMLLFQRRTTTAEQRGTARLHSWQRRSRSRSDAPRPHAAHGHRFRRRPLPRRDPPDRQPTGSGSIAGAGPRHERALLRLARQWHRNSVMALAVAAIAGVRAAADRPRWDTGDLLLGLWFAGLSLLYWGRAAAIDRARAISPSIAFGVVVLALGLGVGGALLVTDIATAGRL
jgi:EmrB/QacA subfamily drug resistance transporter